MRDGDREKEEVGEMEYERCAYCGADLPAEAEDVKPPAVDDDEAWAELAKEHGTGCEWVETRAHRLEVER